MWWLIPIGLVLAALFTFGTGLTSCDIIDGAGLNASVACLGIDPSLSASGTATTYPKDFNQLSFVTNSAKLANDAFVSKAPEAVVTKERERLAALEEEASALREQLERLG